MASKLEQYKNEIIEKYKNGLSTNKIAKIYGCNSGTIYFLLKNNGIETKKRQKFEGSILDTEKTILELFDSGISGYSIAKKIKMSKATVLRVLRKNKREMKCDVDYNNLLKHKLDKVIELFNNGKSINKIAKILSHNSISVRQLLIDNGYDTHKYKCIYTLDETFFEKIDTEEKAYCLGFWYSDGNVMSSGKIRISIATLDEDILYKIKDCMKWTGPILQREREGNRKKQSTLNIDRQKVAQDLIKLGCPPRKSLILEFPTEKQVPKHLLSHFLRGMFDGDGGFTVKNRRLKACGITSTDIFCSKMEELMSELGIIATNFYYRNEGKPTGSLVFSRKEEMKKFCDYLYRDATIFMNRKMKIYNRFLKTY